MLYYLKSYSVRSGDDEYTRYDLVTSDKPYSFKDWSQDLDLDEEQTKTMEEGNLEYWEEPRCLFDFNLQELTEAEYNVLSKYL